MIAIVSKENDLGRQEFVCNSSDVTEAEAVSGVVEATISVSGARHGDKITCIETEEVYLYSEPDDKWIRKE